jgi:hypothetical protein
MISHLNLFFYNFSLHPLFLKKRPERAPAAVTAVRQRASLSVAAGTPRAEVKKKRFGFRRTDLTMKAARVGSGVFFILRASMSAIVPYIHKGEAAAKMVDKMIETRVFFSLSKTLIRPTILSEKYTQGHYVFSAPPMKVVDGAVVSPSESENFIRLLV